MTEKQITIRQFRNAIKALPEDEPQVKPGIWYKTQKGHWLGWLRGYSGPGAYNRKNWHRDARFAYNHVVCPELLIYLIRNLSLPAEVAEAAEKAYATGSTMMATSGAIRKVVPWEMVYQAIWGREGEDGAKNRGLSKFFK